MAETTMPRTAKIASTFGKFSPSCVLAGLLGIHVGVIPPLGGFLFFQLGLLTGLLALGFGIAAVVMTRSAPQGPGRSAGWLGMASGMVILTVAIAGSGGGGSVPAINDITTDLEDPPQFAQASVVPDFEGRDMSYPQAFVEQVRSFYAEVQPVRLDQDAATAYQKAVATVQALGWEIAYQDASAMTIDARDTSLVFKFVDDIVVRVRTDGSGAIVDIRSKSRDGKSDLGANAARIKEFVAALTQ
jgi:uncharacterized protein (DUF1499 family)